MSDAGTPLISDPGYKLVREASEAGHTVTASPGPSAVLAALSVAALPTDRFFFEGFLPPKQARGKNALPRSRIFRRHWCCSRADRASLRRSPILPARLGARAATICRELTKLHEEIKRGDLTTLARDYAEGARDTGEFVIVIAPPEGDDEATWTISTICCAER